MYKVLITTTVIIGRISSQQEPAVSVHTVVAEFDTNRADAETAVRIINSQTQSESVTQKAVTLF